MPGKMRIEGRRVMYHEDVLSGFFAEYTKESPQFASWVLNRTKFGAFSGSARLMHWEQMALRPRKFWWKDWWCNFPGQIRQGGQIDIFMVFELPDKKKRFSLHFENKKANGTFEPGQVVGYELRAKHMANKPEYLDYNDFETLLIAPLAFQNGPHGIGCDQFTCIPYEDISDFVPQFRKYLDWLK
jgi:hypothetical protein